MLSAGTSIIEYIHKRWRVLVKTIATGVSIFCHVDN
jgi:hypothetical protein